MVKRGRGAECSPPPLTPNLPPPPLTHFTTPPPLGNLGALPSPPPPTLTQNLTLFQQKRKKKIYKKMIKKFWRFLRIFDDFLRIFLVIFFSFFPHCPSPPPPLPLPPSPPPPYSPPFHPSSTLLALTHTPAFFLVHIYIPWLHL